MIVPPCSPLFCGRRGTADIPQHFPAKVERFFHVYKELEGVRAKALSWENAEQAKERIEYAAELYKKMIG